MPLIIETSMASYDSLGMNASELPQVISKPANNRAWAVKSRPLINIPYRDGPKKPGTRGRSLRDHPRAELRNPLGFPLNAVLTLLETIPGSAQDASPWAKKFHRSAA
jgi:hypothetical protein